MRKEDLREATKRTAERDGHKLKTRLSQGEKRKRGDTEAYWTFRKTEELKRNHLSRMANHDFGRVTVRR